MRTRVWIGIVGAIIFILGFLGWIGWMFTQSPYGDLYIVMMFIGALMVAAAKFISWIER